MPFDLLKEKLMLRLDTMGIRITKVYEEVKYYHRSNGTIITFLM